MATYISTINRVLRRLRESEVASPTDSDYSQLIGDFVNEAKREVEDAWEWTALRQQIQVTTAASTNGYAITGAGQRFRFVDPLGRAYDETNNNWVRPGHYTKLKEQLQLSSNTGAPKWFYIEGTDTNDDPQVYFFNIPGGTYTINFDLVVPQDDLTDGTTRILVPEYPVFLGAYAKAIAERGEDNGTTNDRAEAKFTLALQDAVTIDTNLAQGEDVWTVT